MSAKANEIRRFILRVVRDRGDSPINEDTILDALDLRYGDELTRDDGRAHIKALGREDFLTGTSVVLLGIVWGLTPKGRVAVQQFT